METTYPVNFVDHQMGIHEMAQVIRALPYLDQMRKAGKQLHQAWCIALHRRGVMQHDTDSARPIFLEKACQLFKASFFFESQRSKIAIEDQDLAFGSTENRVAGLSVFGFTGEQCVGWAHGGKCGMLPVGTLVCHGSRTNHRAGCLMIGVARLSVA